MTLKQLNNSDHRQHHRQLSTVHLAGLSIVTYAHSALGGTGQQTHNSDVLMHALRDPVVLLLSGLMTGNAGYMTNVVNIIIMVASRSLKSLDDVTIRQVGYDVSKCSPIQNYFVLSVIVILLNHFTYFSGTVYINKL